MKISRALRKRRVVCLLAICLIFGAGCGSEDKVEPVEITLMHGYGGTLESYEMMQEIYDGFSEQNPDIRLKCIEYMNNEIVADKATDMLAVGEMPDIVSTNSQSYFVENAVKSGMALDLMPYIDADLDWKSHIHPSVLETWRMDDGGVYTIPDVLELGGYWYNKRYFENAGILEENGGVMPQTWESFIDMVEKLQNWIDREGKDISVFSLEKDQLTDGLFLAALAGESPEGFSSAVDPENGINGAAVERTVGNLAELNKYSEPVNNIESVRQRFIEGKTVIYFNGVWESEELEKSRLSKDFEYAVYPSYDGTNIGYIAAPSGYVLAKQENKIKEKACIRFLKYMLSDEVQKRIAVETGQAPCNPMITTEQISKDAELLGKAIAVVNGSDKQIQTIATAWGYDRLVIVDEYLGQSMEDPFMLEQMLDELHAE